jgi:hypothetical protein
MFFSLLTLKIIDQSVTMTSGGSEERKSFLVRTIHISSKDVGLSSVRSLHALRLSIHILNKH